MNNILKFNKINMFSKMKAVIDSRIMKTTFPCFHIAIERLSDDAEDIYCGYGNVLYKYITRDKTVSCEQELTSMGF